MKLSELINISPCILSEGAVIPKSPEELDGSPEIDTQIPGSFVEEMINVYEKYGLKLLNCICEFEAFFQDDSFLGEQYTLIGEVQAISVYCLIY